MLNVPDVERKSFRFTRHVDSSFYGPLVWATNWESLYIHCTSPEAALRTMFIGVLFVEDLGIDGRSRSNF